MRTAIEMREEHATSDTSSTKITSLTSMNSSCELRHSDQRSVLWFGDRLCNNNFREWWCPERVSKALSQWKHQGVSHDISIQMVSSVSLHWRKALQASRCGARVERVRGNVHCASSASLYVTIDQKLHEQTVPTPLRFARRLTPSRPKKLSK